MVNKQMSSKYLSVNAIILSCILMIILSSCNLITTYRDRFYVDKDNCLTMIDIGKNGSDIIVPEKVGNTVIHDIYLKSSHFSKIDSIDVSNVSELETFTLRLYGAGSHSKLKRIDFSRNEKLKDIFIDNATALEKIVFNKNCEIITLRDTSLENVNLKPLKNLSLFSYFNGPLHSIEFSSNKKLDYLSFYYSKVKKLDLSKLKKLR